MGWIDGVTRKADDDRTSVLIAPRNPKSAWSAINKAHVDAARSSGAMTPAGEAAIAATQANGIWSFLNDVECPDHLIAALKAARSLDGWNAYPPNVKRGALEWIKTAKTAPTRTKRITDLAENVAQGTRPSPFRW
ncbi:YdeI family protein [Actibacterium sp. 188UL27-1]|uniref:YdeI/OmpD-associated family protein n=1 Tax=Actibacterium sp. 188UL27-1 TaxID=2786961 RepID=UPI0019570E45|nr:YdeI/OmpD-associated family protein [Actibacterium sp. 188UL27-1]MBM7066260.1 YdeI/OmpD-associated family protein [Actibacterium sp. 188UL27-1]